MDVIVSPMTSLNPVSTNIGQALASVVGPLLTAKFHKEAGGAALPGETVVLDSLPGLKCKTVIFLNLDRWDNNPNGRPMQVKKKFFLCYNCWLNCVFIKTTTNNP